MQVDYDKIRASVPDSLKALANWHCWDLVKGTKIPLQLDGETKAKSNDPNTWGTFEDALESAEMFNLGVAFEIGLKDDQRIVGIDLDNCIREPDKDPRDARNYEPWAVPIVQRFASIAYGEISPSGTGIKFLVQGVKAAEARCVAKFSGHKQQLEVYGHSRFWAITGDVVGDGDYACDQESLDWICSEHLIEKARPVVVNTPQVVVGGSTACSGLSEFDRAKVYVEKSDAVQEGGRNNSAFRMAGNLISFRGEAGTRLSADEVIQLMHYWNATKVSPPLSEEEVKHVTNSAARNGSARADKVSGPLPDVADLNSNTELSGFYNEGDDDEEFAPNWAQECLDGTDGEPGFAGAVDLRLPVPRDVFIELYLAGSLDEIDNKPVKLRAEEPIPQRLIDNAPGIIQDYMEWCRTRSNDQLQEAFFSGALSLVATVTGRKVRDKKYGTRSNLMCAVLAPTGAGKDFARRLNKKVLIQIDSNMMGSEKPASATAIEKEMSENPVRLMQLDEFGQYLSSATGRNAAPHKAEIPDVLTTMFTNASEVVLAKTYADSANNITLNQPHLVVYATTTPDKFWSSLNMEQVSTGFLGRVLVFSDPYDPNYSDKDVDAEEKPDKIIKFCRFWQEIQAGGDMAEMAMGTPDPVVIEWSKEAKELYAEHHKGIKTVSYTHLTLPTMRLRCRSRWSPYH